MVDATDNHHRNCTKSYWPFWLACGLTVVFCLLGVMQGVSSYGFVQEGGPIENASVAILICGGVGFAVLRPDLALGRAWHIPVLMLLLAARELDFDKRFMDKGVLQLRLYSGDYPLQQKLIGAFFVLLILYALYRVVRHGWRPLLTGLRFGALWAWAVVAAGVSVVVAKSLDGAGRKLAPYGIELSEQTDALFVLLEEYGELAFGLLLVLAICNWVRRAADARVSAST